MDRLSEYAGGSIEALLRPEGFSCSCGKHHTAPLGVVRIGPGVIEELPATAKKLGMQRPALLADRSTWAAAGQQAFAPLEQAGLQPARCLLDTSRPEADEHWLGAAAAAFPTGCDGVVSVGSGTIGDIGKMLAGIARRPLINLGTAPSMDGFASTSASLLVGGLKKSIPAPCPNAILADTALMAKAPRRMLLAGLGDMLAKYVSLCEWRVSNLINGEYYCGEVAALVRASLAACRAAAEGLLRRDPAAVAETVRGLVLCGIAMSFAGVTRPASGVEHYFSHVWEMMAVREGRTPDLHGIQVGVGVALALPLYDKLRAETPDKERARHYRQSFDRAAFLARVKENLAMNDEAAERQRAWIENGAAARLGTIAEKWPEILAIMAEELPDTDEMMALYQSTGLPAHPAEVGVSEARARESLIDTKDIRDKYVLTTLLSDLGLLEEYAAVMAV